MGDFNQKNFKKTISDAEVAFIGMPTKESLNYMSYGTMIRDNLYSKAMELLKNGGYEKVMISDLVKPDSLNEIDKISKVSGGYFKVDDKDLLMAAGHEVNAYLFIKELLKHYYQQKELPIKIYNLGSIYRTNRNTKFPFNLGERKSFLECYSVFKTLEEAENELDFATDWNRKIIKEILHIPSVESIRPISTNKKISKKTICIDSITPLDETVITGMSYLHDDVFTKALDVKYKDQLVNKNKLAHSIHFGLSENILFSYLLNSFDGQNLRLYSFLAPIQVGIINTIEDCNSKPNYKKFRNFIDNNYQYNIDDTSRGKISSVFARNVLKGIPINIVLKNHDNDLLATVYLNNNECFKFVINEQVNYGSIKRKIDILLLENDKNIIRDMETRERDTIIDCDNINTLNDVVKSGKVAKVFLANNDDNVANIEKYLSGGEVLGFGLDKEEGIDIITNEKVDTIAYLSRRS